MREPLGTGLRQVVYSPATYFTHMKTRHLMWIGFTEVLWYLIRWSCKTWGMSEQQSGGIFIWWASRDIWRLLIQHCVQSWHSLLFLKPWEESNGSKHRKEMASRAGKNTLHWEAFKNLFWVKCLTVQIHLWESSRKHRQALGALKKIIVRTSVWKRKLKQPAQLNLSWIRKM